MTGTLHRPRVKQWVALVAAALGGVALGVGGIALVIARRRGEVPPRDRHLIHTSLQSHALDDRRELFIHLPGSYDDQAARRYPVLYVLDGSAQNFHTAESARVLARVGLMPETIVVGVASTRRDRGRDFTPPGMQDPNGRAGRADRYLRFLEAEVIPEVERKYRTTAPRMIAGHSLGALFVIHSLLERPALFEARFAYSPSFWLGDGRMVTQLARWLQTAPADPGFLYLSVGDREGDGMLAPFRKVAALLGQSAPAGWRWRAEVTAGANHLSNPVLSTPTALADCFATGPPRRDSAAARP
jgi:predicted alpha/beta superfamily hydrolase